MRSAHQGTANTLRVALLGAGVIGSSACTGSEAEPGQPRLLPAQFAAAVSVPLSVNTSIALVDSLTACVVDSYEVRVVCVHIDGSTAGSFGREGEGPGEFGGALSLMRGSAGTLGVFDARQGRMTVFEPSGAILSQTAIPPLFAPMAPFGRTVVGTYEAFGGGSSQARVAEVDLESGDLVHESVLPHPSELGVPLDCEGGHTTGAADRGGRLAFGTCRTVLVRWEDDVVVTFRDPTHVPEFPSDTDIETHRERMRIAFGAYPPESQMLQYAQTPKWGLIPGRSLLYDEWGRLWVATQRDRSESSYFSIFSDTTYVGSVQVRDRVEGYDLLGNTLVVLVERLPEDPADIPGRGVDWYRFESPGSGQ